VGCTFNSVGLIITREVACIIHVFTFYTLLFPLAFKSSSGTFKGFKITLA
jgi:hypothetical protein